MKIKILVFKNLLTTIGKITQSNKNFLTSLGFKVL